MKRIVHHISKWLSRLIAALLLLLLLAGNYYCFRGYQMYRDAVEEKSLEERVEEIRNMENFTVYSDLPEFYRKAVLSVEDHRFESHRGIDLLAIARAAWTDIRTLSFREGGSTITQQLAKNMLFTQEKRMERKAAEIFAALELEKRYTKEEIFELYVNSIYFGSGYYGIYQAAMGYFGKTPPELKEYECVLLAGVPGAPSVYSPDVSRELAAKRVAQVLDSMVEHKLLTRARADEIVSPAP